MDEHGMVGEGEMEAVVTGMPKHTNAMALRWAAIGNAVAEPFPLELSG